MKKLTTIFVGMMLATFCATLAAQEPKPYKEGQVTEISYIKIKPGKFDDYMKWLDGPYKTLMEANKKAAASNRATCCCDRPCGLCLNIEPVDELRLRDHFDAELLCFIKLAAR